MPSIEPTSPASINRAGITANIHQVLGGSRLIRSSRAVRSVAGAMGWAPASPSSPWLLRSSTVLLLLPTTNCPSGV